MKAACKMCGSEMQSEGEICYKKILHEKSEMYIQQIGVCKSCGFVTVLNIPQQDELDALYLEGDDYTNLYDPREEKRAYVSRVEKCISILQTLKLDYRTVLDIGASTGYLLYCIKNIEQKDVFGIETSLQGIRRAKEVYGLDLYHGTFQEYVHRKEMKKYDLVCICHVLEHIVDINEFVRLLTEINNKYVYIEVPSLSERIQNEPYGFFAEEHLNYFTPYSLNYLMGHHGYENIHLTIDHMVGHKVANGFPMISAVYEKRADVGETFNPVVGSDVLLQKYLEYSKREMERIIEIVDNIPDNMRLAVWGVSFQLERLFAYTNLEKKNIVCFIDNSQERQKNNVYIRNESYSIIGIHDLLIDSIDKILLTTWNNQEGMLKQMKEMQIEDMALIIY